MPRRLLETRLSDFMILNYVLDNGPPTRSSPNSGNEGIRRIGISFVPPTDIVYKTRGRAANTEEICLSMEMAAGT